MRIVIHESVDDTDAMVELLEHIAEKVSEGFIAGYHPGWDLVADGISVSPRPVQLLNDDTLDKAVEAILTTTTHDQWGTEWPVFDWGVDYRFNSRQSAAAFLRTILLAAAPALVAAPSEGDSNA